MSGIFTENVLNIVPDKNQMQMSIYWMKINIPLFNVIGKAINFTYCSFFSPQNISTTSADVFFFHSASGGGWLHFSNVNLLLPLYIPCTPTSSMHCLTKFLYNILTTTNVYPLTHKHVLSFSCNSLPQVSPASHLADLP